PAHAGAHCRDQPENASHGGQPPDSARPVRGHHHHRPTATRRSHPRTGFHRAAHRRPNRRPHRRRRHGAIGGRLAGYGGARRAGRARGFGISHRDGHGWGVGGGRKGG